MSNPRWALLPGMLLVLTACAPTPGLSPEPTVTPTAAVPSLSAEPTVEVPDPETTEPVIVLPGEAPTEPPPAPTAPAPSTAGSLTESDVAKADGWLPTAKPGSPEEGFMGNGTWVHATSAEHSAFAAISFGCAELGSYPQPTAALEGNLADAAGHPGVGLTLEFASEDDAKAYFTEWLRQAEACVGTATQKIRSTDDSWLGRRNLDPVWSEAAGVRGHTVRFLIVESPDADLSQALEGAR